MNRYRSPARVPTGLVLLVPAIALALLAGVLLVGGDRAAFLQVNALADMAGAGLWAPVTILGDGLVCAVLLIPWMRRNPERAWAALLGALVMVVVLRVFKELLSIPRPLAVFGADAFTLIGPGYRRSAFPSGHAATVFLFAGAWIMAARRARWELLLLLPAAAVSLSRIVVGVHWPSDVLAGALLGWLSAWIGLRWAGRARVRLAAADRALMAALTVAAAALLFIDHTGYPGALWTQRGIALICLGWGAWTIHATSHLSARAGESTGSREPAQARSVNGGYSSRSRSR